MKETLKKWTVGLLAVLLAFSGILLLGTVGISAEDVPSFHPDPIQANTQLQDGSITVISPHEGKAYTAYKIFDLFGYQTIKKEDGTEETIFSYGLANYANNPWKAFFYGVPEGANNGEGYKYIQLDKEGYVLSKADQFDAEAFAKAALDYAKSYEATYPSDTTLYSQDLQLDTQGNMIATGLPYGYYVVDSSAGALCSLNTVAKNAQVKEKNELPTIDLQVQNPSHDDDTWMDNNESTDEEVVDTHGQVGDTIEYQVIIEAKAGAQNYVLTNVFDLGLECAEDSISVQQSTIENPGTFDDVPNVNNVNYTAKYDKTANTLTVVFTDKFLNDLNGKQLKVAFKATLTGDIIDAEKGNKAHSTATLYYGDGVTKGADGNMIIVQNTKNKTTEDKATVQSHTLTIDKQAAKAAETDLVQHLAGATFKLSRTEENGKAIHWKTIQENSVPKLSTEPIVDDDELVVTDANGAIKLQGLDAGIYWLEETQAPTGYNKLTTKIKVQIATNGDASVTYDGATTVKATNGKITIENKTGTELPTTGGIGTKLFYAGGGLLMLISLIVLVARRKSSADQQQ